MSDMQTIVAEPRARAGKGAARQCRRSGRIPAVIYGNKEEPTLVQLDERALLKEIGRGGFTSRILELDVAGRKQRVLARDVQLDPVTDRPVHVDFLRIVASSRLRLMIPVVFTDDLASPGLKRGGVLNVVRHEIEFHCRADSIPEKIVVSLAGTEIGHSIHISHVQLPAGIKPVIANRDFTIATIAPPTTGEEAAPAAAEAAPAAAARAAAEAKPAAAQPAKK